MSQHDTRNPVDRDLVRAVLARGGNVAAAAAEIGCHRWTIQRIVLEQGLQHLVVENPRVTPSEIAPLFGTTASAISAALRRFGATKDSKRSAQRHRPCLSCDHVFFSEGSHNRLCNDCRSRNAGVAL